MSQPTTLLAEIPLFALLDDQERFALAGLMELHRIPAGSRIYTAGDPGDSLFIVRSGRVRGLMRNNLGEEIVVEDVEPGEVFSEVSLLDGGPRAVSSEAVEDSELLEIDRPALLEFFAQHPHAAIDLMTVLGRRFRSISELLRNRAARNVNVEEATRLSLGDRVADRVAAFGGSWTFILSSSVVLAAWMVANALLLRWPFDPYPFILLNLVLSTLAAIQAPIIMMSQNRQAAKDRLKADLDYQVNLKAELEVAELHAKVDRLLAETLARLSALDRRSMRAESGLPPDRST